ncbi:PKD-like family protein [Sphingobacterium nematocida]|uniref:PKD-like family protein n=1 Tax=Sphingobacterium nematocida TaxID=1513896 RepID=A0A1T5ATR1_9SPHI|nr:PKD-like family lipoprotein [Sphingobacterium nematocida]SKB38388.1 PKD-like family protein [Sphingobacterium nematocida]
MKTMNTKYSLNPSLGMLIAGFLLVQSCAKDLGNYSYQDINELEISNWQNNYSALTDIDTLRINPTFSSSFNINDTANYDFRWVLKEGVFNQDTIGRAAHLNFPVHIQTGNYNLQYRVTDKNTGVTFVKTANLTIGTPYNRGILLTGEDMEGNAEAAMLSMIKDTIYIDEMVKKSGIDRTLKGAKHFFYGAGIYDGHKLMWFTSETGSYYLDRKTMKSTPMNTFSNFLLPTDPIEIQKEYLEIMAPQIIDNDGKTGDESYKIVLSNTGNIYTTYTSLSAGMFYNPVNRVASNFDELLPAAPYLMYPMGSMSSMMWYDTKNGRLMNITGFIGIDQSTYPIDKAGDPFSWDVSSEGKKLRYAENTFNKDGGFNNGNTFAVVGNALGVSNIYKFHARGSNPIKLANYPVKPLALYFDQATQYAFSSTRTVVFYTYQNKLYAYDYNPGNERFYELNLFPGKEITMIKFDTQQNPTQNSLYVATHDTPNGGTLQRFVLDADPNTVRLNPVLNAKWENLLKIKDVNWKAERY